MKVLVLVMLLGVTIPGWTQQRRGHEGGNGGNSCDQTLERMAGPDGDLMKALSLTCQGYEKIHERAYVGPCLTYPLPKKLFDRSSELINEKAAIYHVLFSGEHLDLGVFRYFTVLTKKVYLVPKIDGDKEGMNSSEIKHIALSREKWCPKPEAEKLSVLFHEYLGVMEIEGDNQYPVSKYFLPAYLKLANP